MNAPADIEVRGLRRALEVVEPALPYNAPYLNVSHRIIVDYVYEHTEYWEWEKWLP